LIRLKEKKIDRYLKDINKKFENWLEENLKEEVILAIEKDIKDNDVHGISINDLRANADTIYGIIDSLGGQKMKQAFYKSLNEIFNTIEFDKLSTVEDTELQNFEKMLEFIIAQNGFKYNLQIPGLLLDTNSDMIKGNQLSWQFKPIEAFFIETSQRAESRIVNVWAFLVSGVFLVLVIIFLLFPVFKKK
jgi:ribosome-binding factor A